MVALKASANVRVCLGVARHVCDVAWDRHGRDKHVTALRTLRAKELYESHDSYLGVLVELRCVCRCRGGSSDAGREVDGLVVMAPRQHDLDFNE